MVKREAARVLARWRVLYAVIGRSPATEKLSFEVAARRRRSVVKREAARVLARWRVLYTVIGRSPATEKLSFEVAARRRKGNYVQRL